MGKPMAERFAEAVKMVKLSTGASSAGSPGAPDTDGAKIATEKQMAAEIARKAKQAEGLPGSVPNSMSDIHGGEPIDNLDRQLDTLDAAEIADLETLSVAAIDRYLARREATGAA